MRPPQVNAIPIEADNLDAIVEAVVHPQRERWELLLSKHDVQVVWRLWTWVVEGVLLALRLPGLELQEVCTEAPLPKAPAKEERSRGRMQLAQLCP